MKSERDTFQRLTEEQLKRLHTASLEVMERTGVRFQAESALAVSKGGCRSAAAVHSATPSEWALDICQA